MTLSPRCFGIFGGLAAALGMCTALAGAQELSREAQARFAAQVAVLESEKAGRTPPQQKLDSALVLSLPGERAKVAALGALRTPQALKAEAAPRVRIEGTVDANLLLAIRRAGGQVQETWANEGVVYAKLTPSQAESIAALPQVNRIKLPSPMKTHAVISEGDRTHRADNARKNYGATGKGLKIGVLSDSVDYLSRSQAAGELPNVTVLPGQSGTPDELGNQRSGEGTAMLEIVHDLVPDAELYFATAFTGEEQFAQNILDLRAAGCDIIVDDVFYFDEAPFQDGVIAKAVNSVVADGALYFSAAGNEGGLNDGTSGCWEGDFKASSETLTGSDPGKLLDWGGSSRNGSFNIGSGTYGYLFWSDPLGASKNDYDLYAVNSRGEIVEVSNGTQNGTQDPIETVTIYPGDQTVVKLFSGQRRYLHYELIFGELQYRTAGRTRGHGAAEKAIGVAAAPANGPFDFGQPSGPYPQVFNANSQTETFSSDGPRRIFFAPNGDPFNDAGFLMANAKKLNKPDITAADGVMTTVPGFQPFYGTSAAAPHAAAIAAQIWSVDRSQTATQVKSRLFGSAIDIRTVGWDRDSGKGIVMAAAGVKAALPGISIAPVTVKESDATVFADFPLTLTKASTEPIVIQFQTVDITAKGGVDYRAKRGEVTFAAGETKQTIRVPVYADALTENTEEFRVKLLSATNARIDIDAAKGTILDSSAASGVAAKSAGKF